MPDLILVLKAALMGMVEGLTEFLPVSSTGHLILFGHVLRFEGASASVFEIVIQVGAILSVLWIYRAKFLHVALSLKDEAQSRKFLSLLLVAFLPAAVLGLSLHRFIKEHLFNPQVVAISLIVGGVVMLIIEKLRLPAKVDDVDRMDWLTALKIGFYQCLAMVPGVSRSGATIIGGMLSGLDRKTAAEFSFFLAVPTLTAAALYDLYKNWASVSANDLWLMAVGFIASFLFGLLAIVGFIRLVVRLGFAPFAWYRIVLGAVILAVGMNHGL
ncbi:MAG TPA: undecaprenyl-diphosphate phosphatase [Alphaproteobacteria bacterium]|nr:undecaprenyl-diphosphate phosphatase [Alphaproteobacteria bacterium]